MEKKRLKIQQKKKIKNTSKDVTYVADQRVIGRWTIGATLGKGGYSWVKRGQDIKTGKIVALKFMEKADVSWVKEQAKQVETEIEALKNIRHQNVMKLYAYNLNAQYPLAPGASDEDGHTTQGKDGSSTDKDGQKYIDTILLVLEYAPGGELFDILYYTSALKETVARTYFKQIISGLEACHNANVVHRDLKPQNLLLDAKYNLKITDFGLSKIIQSDADAIMKTTYVGTRGYQAPELLLNQKYDLKCDIFSVGVILFILLAGYPPFEQASKNDKWFKPLMKGNIEKFWKAHQKSPIAQIPEAKDLLTSMLCFDPKKRIDMNGIKTHKWMQGSTLKQKELITEIRDRHRKAEKKRRQDVRKMNDLAQSLNPNKPIPGIEKAKLKLFPKELVEGILGEAYTFLEPKQEWYDLYNMLEEAITEKGKGKADFNFEKGILQCEMNVQRNMNVAPKEEQKEALKMDCVKFNIEIMESRLWKDRYLEVEDQVDEIKESNEHLIFVVRVTRTEGDTLVFNRLKNGFMLTYCSSIIKGFPDWARKLEKKENAGKDVDNEDDAKEAELNDEYSKELGDIFKKENKGGIQVVVKT
eukprot:252639_1